MSTLFGTLEAGGTKFLCAVGTGPDDVRDIERVPTSSPEETLSAVIAYFQSAIRRHGPLAALGVASFGPADIDPASPQFGSILATPKPGWSNTAIVKPLQNALSLPIGFDTDVNGAALAESVWGAAQGLDCATYVTVGTGIGGGSVVNGRTVHGLRHPEIGHFYPPRHPADLDFPGCCPFHGACYEGLASGPAIERRWGVSLSHLSADHEAHAIIAYYLGHLATTLQGVLSSRRIIFGGGVCHAPGLIARIRAAAMELGAGYFCDPAALETLIVPPGLGDKAGLLGGIRLAQLACQAA